MASRYKNLVGVLGTYHNTKYTVYDALRFIAVSVIGIVLVYMVAVADMSIVAGVLVGIVFMSLIGQNSLLKKVLNPDNFGALTDTTLSEDVLENNHKTITSEMKFIKEKFVFKLMQLCVGGIEVYIWIEYGKMPEIAALWATFYIGIFILYMQAHKEIKTLTEEYTDLKG